MLETDRHSGSTDWIDLYFVEKEKIPEQIIELSVQVYLAGLLLLNTDNVSKRRVTNKFESLFTIDTKSRITADPRSHRDC